MYSILDIDKDSVLTCPSDLKSENAKVHGKKL